MDSDRRMVRQVLVKLLRFLKIRMAGDFQRKYPGLLEFVSIAQLRHNSGLGDDQTVLSKIF